MPAAETKKTLKRPTKEAQRLAAGKKSVVTETTGKQTRSFKPANSSQLIESQSEQQDEPHRTLRKFKRRAPISNEDEAPNKRLRPAQGSYVPTANVSSQEFLIQGGFARKDPSADQDSEEESEEDYYGRNEVPQAKAQKITKVKSKTAKKGSGASRKPRQTTVNAVDGPDWDFDEDDEDDYDGPLPEEQPAETPGLVPEPVMAIDGLLQYNQMVMFDLDLYQKVPQCVKFIEAFWKDKNSAELLKLRTNLAPKLELQDSWDAALNIVKNVSTASRTDLMAHMEELRTKLKELTQRNEWRRKHDIVHDYYLIVYPMTVMLAMLSVAALTPLYKDAPTKSVEACRAVDCIHSFIIETKDLEFHMTNSKLANTIHGFRRDISKATRPVLEALKGAFCHELKRRKGALAKIDAVRARKRAERAEDEAAAASRAAKRAERDKAAEKVRAEAEAVEARRKLKLQVHWARQTARMEMGEERAFGLSRDLRQHKKEKRCWKYRDIIWTRLTQIMEPMDPHLSANERVQACVGDPLFVDFGMSEDDIQRSTMDMVLWNVDECKKRGWDVEKWVWIRTLLDEWNLWDGANMIAD